MAVDVKSNKIDDITKNLYPEVDTKVTKRKRKVIERVLIVLALIGSCAVISLYTDLFGRYIEQSYPKTAIYGTWSEEKVAKYAKEELTLGSEGVSRNGNLVSTEFSYDGKYLEFTTGEGLHRYRFTNEAKTHMVQVSDNHYNPAFVLVGKHKKQLR